MSATTPCTDQRCADGRADPDAKNGEADGAEADQLAVHQVRRADGVARMDSSSLLERSSITPCSIIDPVVMTVTSKR